jgi:hypothetical protein
MKNFSTKTKQNPTIGTSLTADDLRNLSDCFITPDIAELAGLSRVTDEEGAAILNRKRNASADYSGLIIPYKNPKTGQVIEYETRRDYPDVETKNGRDKEVNKYLRPAGSKSLAYFVPGTNLEHFKDTECFNRQSQQTIAFFDCRILRRGQFQNYSNRNKSHRRKTPGQRCSAGT